MSNRDIKKFLPPIFKTKEINNFLDSTTNKLFEEKKSERINYYIGKKSGGVYEHLTDPYAEERTKLREDYQLDPSLVERDPQTGEVNSILYYEDLLNNLSSSGSYTVDQNRLFQQEAYSYAPPIDYDMFVNFRDYYWIPEGAPAIEIDASPNDIIGSINYNGKVVGVDEFLTFTTGNHVILNDGKEYTVDGVGNSIRLQEFDRANNIPLRVTRSFFADTLSEYEKFPKEYITMERGAMDNNTWSRNNAWYHRDALFPNVSTRPDIEVERERRALRPIIQFIRDIELYDYHRGEVVGVDVYHAGNVLPTDIIDDVTVVDGMTAIKQNSKKIYQYTSGAWNEYSEPTGIVVITDGRMNKSRELLWVSGWIQQQAKTANTQPILFQLYDSNDSNASPVGEGNSIFAYKQTVNGIYDEELQLTIEYRMSGDSSDYTFENSIREYAESIKSENTSYKVFNSEIPITQRLLQFTIGTDVNDKETIFVNDEDLPTIIINSGVPYEFEYSDSSTTANGWFGEYFPITVVDDADNQLIRPTHGHSNTTRVIFQYDLPSGVDEEILYYRLETDYNVNGRIVVLNDVEVPEFELFTDFRRKGTLYNTLRQHFNVIEDGVASIELKYQPLSDNFTVKLNGEDVSDYTFNRRVVSMAVKRGDLVEVFYSTRNKITDTDDIIQEVYPSLTNNAGNDDPIVFSFSEIFNHFGSIIRNQRFLVGTPLGTNSYRDTGKNITVGDDILKHTAPMLPLMFINKNDNINLIEAIEHSNVFYTQYKNNITLKAEEYVRDNEVTVTNVKDVFDTIISDLNSAKQSTESFSGSFMFASYRNYISIGLSTTGELLQPVDLLNPRNTMYVYTALGGLQIINYDYEISFDESTGKYTLIPITFTLDDIDIIRYYDDVQPTFCPATPAKFGIFKPIKPTFFIDDTYNNDVLMIIGHDNSKTVAYTKLTDYYDGVIDGRDMILLEFENRIFNGINAEFKVEDLNVIDKVRYTPGKFRKIEYTREEYTALEYERFFRWSTLNMTDYTTNYSYSEGDEFTYNYSYNVDMDGEKLPGHWKGIFNYYYDTFMPHRKPWEMLGFDIKPTWFDSEYGVDYSSSNTHLWSDLEEGIIRQGSRSNVTARAYLNNNPYRREGLSNVIPVDVNGELKSPISIGICTEPTAQDAKKPWRFGDNGPVEQAWKTLSEYAYNNVSVLYTLKPADITARLWNTEVTVGNDNLQNIKVSTYKVHREVDNEAVFGLTQWIYDLILGDNLTPLRELIEPFRNVELNLAHKVGGFVNASELRLYSESYNPDSETLSTLVPREDINIMTYQSKDIYNEVYSGVVIERVEASKAYYSYVNGYAYTQGDIIYSFDDDAYYRMISNINYVDWKSNTTYTMNSIVRYDNNIYVCLESHTSSNTIRPGNTDYWILKPLDLTEWAILINPPKNTQSEFKVYGYNVRSPFFPVSIPKNGSNKKRVSVVTSKSSPVNANEWVSGQYYKRGHIVTYGGEYYEANVSHRSGNSFASELWIGYTTTPMVGNVDVYYTTESSGDVDMIEYGQRFKTLDDVVEFLASYGRELVNRGWVFNEYDQSIGAIKNWEYIIKEFVRWSTDYRDVGSAITLSPFSTSANFKPKHGVVSLINQFKRSAFNLLDYRSAIIPSDSINVTRTNGLFNLVSPEPIYFLRLGIREYEHSINVSNETIFGDVNYDPVIGIRKDRLRLSGTKTTEWDGQLHAPGYIITDDGMIPNLTTVSEELLSVNDMDTVATKDIINELKYHNIGYQKRDYLENLEMTDKSQINFYQGFIRQKGTSEAFQRLLRSNVIDANETLDISEEWAFREGVFGSNYNKLQVEFYIPSDSFNYNPQKINLVYNSNAPSEDVVVTNISYDDSDSWVMKPERVRDDGSLWATKRPEHVFKTAGYVQYQEHEIKSLNMKSLNQNMIDFGITNISPDITIWLGINEKTHGSWDVLKLHESGAFIGEIYNHGNDGENSAVVKAYNVNENDLYIIQHPDGYYNVTFRYIKDGYYIILSHDNDEYVTFNPNVEYMELTIYEWKSLRIIDNHQDRNIQTVDEFVSDNEIVVNEGMFIYRDSTTYNDHNWEVYQYTNDSWEVIRTPRDIVDISLFNDVVAYDDQDVVLDYVRPFDPILGYIPGSLLHMVDIVSDADPISYTDEEFFHSKYSQMEGTLWLNTNEMIYIDYHQGDKDYREVHWGSLFPGSDVSVYQWTKNEVLPINYGGDVYSETQYITQNIYDNNLGIYKTFYFYWVKNPLTVNPNNKKKVSANEISQSIKYPYNNGVPLLQVIDNYSISILDSSRRLIMNDITLRINYQYQYTSVPTHTQWTLIEESSEQDEVPTFIFQKMIDSILGYDEDMKPIPDPNLPLTSRYGVNRGQTWFVDINSARKVFFEKLNAFIKELNIWDIELFWERLYGGIDTDTNLITFIDWYDQDYEPTTVITNLVNSRIEVTLIPMEDGEYVKVIEPPANKPSMRDGGWTIYQYIEEDDTFKKMGQSGGTIRINIEDILINGIPESEIENMRHIINVMFETFAVRPYHEVINDLLFSMVRLVMAEQPNNNWLFPSTYISIRQELVNLVPSLMYRTDKEQQIRDYIREAKPYHTKLREFNKINKPNDEYVPLKVTDFDKPPHVDKDKNFFILQERFIDTIKPDPDSGQTIFELEFGHKDNIRVTFGEQFVPVDQYRVVGRFIEFVTPPGKDKNYVGSIIVESDNIIHRDIIHEWNPTYGYRILDNTRDIDVWGDLAINKHIQIHYDRISYNNLVDLEKIVEIYDHAFNNEDESYAYIDALSEHEVEEDTLLRELERITIHLYINEAKDIVEKSHIVMIEGNENYFVTINEDYDDEIIFVNNVIINRNIYSVIKEDGNTIYRFMQELLDGDEVIIRPRHEWLSLSKKIGHYSGLNVSDSNPIFVPEHSNHVLVDTDSHHPMLVENDDIVNIDDEVYVFEYDEDSDLVIQSGTFGNESKGYPEELGKLKIYETMMFMSLNQLPPLVKMGYDTIASKIIQPTIAHEIETGVFDYDADIIVPSDQVKVIIQDDVLIQNVDYTVLSDRIRLLRNQPVGETLVITDLYSNFDPNYHNSVKRIKNINGGYDSFVFDYSRVTETPVTREFIVYDKLGNVHYMKCNENNFWTTNIKPTLETTSITLNETLNNMHNRLYVLLGFDLDGSNEMINIDYEIIRGSIINNVLTNMTRGLFVGENTDFSHVSNIRVYPLQVEDGLENFVLQEAIVGITGRDSYPKYGNIFK